MSDESVEKITKVGVVGCGVMGAGFAETCVRAGLDVIVVASSPASIDRGRARVRKSLDGAVRKGKLAEAERDAALDRLAFTSELLDLRDRELVLEAVPEHEPTKLEVFAALDKVVEVENAVLASITSSIPIVRLATATGRAEHVLGLHFFNPAPVLPLVEVIGSLLTGEETLARTQSFVTGVLGKQVIRSKDRSGFVVNALLVPYLLAAVRMLESGFATAEDIDKGMTLGCAHPMGPLALIDLIGADTIVSVGEALYDEFREPLYAPPPLLVRMVDAGLLGKKVGRGFYDYS
ncbi:3-hydroxybutyryl-CoA dehydrogenase [Amycolatopsis sp. CA-230715]|uniref:3-hydroxybutyryl-CoA dehydrogenase n=1 Tax=Amycolatopsis sp. CA-230715 TaxID=2745196 RepID=UPI001C038987|nr:3-hydroxybutyryl-CoA dehydrogenase [Amycolatopsis sp. CA-230715]QWF78534.1 3-hydroxybutyryl-CoA dehydrogenase [Amycolatopsis sp. CA-230715]